MGTEHRQPFLQVRNLPAPSPDSESWRAQTNQHLTPTNEMAKVCHISKRPTSSAGLLAASRRPDAMLERVLSSLLSRARAGLSSDQPGSAGRASSRLRSPLLQAVLHEVLSSVAPDSVAPTGIRRPDRIARR